MKMNTNILKTIFVLFAVLLAAVSVSAAEVRQGDVSMSADYTHVEIENAGVIGVTLKFENFSNEEACIELRTKGNYNGIYAELSDREFCLAGKQKTQFALAVHAEDWAESGMYEIEVIMNYAGAPGTEEIAGFEESVKIEVEVLRTGSIELLPNQRMEFENTGYTKSIPVYVYNNTGSGQKVGLYAESAQFMPEFKTRDGTGVLWIEAGERTEVALEIHINRTTENGFYEFPIYAKTNNGSYVERKVEFEVVGTTEDIMFEFDVDRRNYDIQKGGMIEIGFKVKNLSNEALEINLSSTGRIHNGMYETKINLGAGETYRGYAWVKAKELQEYGPYDITLYAWNADQKEQAVVVVKVLKSHEVEMVLLNDNIKQRICNVGGVEVFEVLIINKGDYTEDIGLYMDNDYETIGHDISEDDFELGAGKEKRVYIAMSPAYDTPVGQKKVYLRMETRSGIDKKIELNFEVVNGEAGKTSGTLVISDYGGLIYINAGEERTLEFTIENNSPNRIENIQVRLYGIGARVYFPALYIKGIDAWGSETVSGKLVVADNAVPKNYNLTLQVSNEDYIATEKIDLRVGRKEGGSGSGNGDEGSGADNSYFAGLAGLANLFNGGITGIGLVILMLLTIIFFVLLLGSNKNRVPRRFIVRARMRV